MCRKLRFSQKIFRSQPIPIEKMSRSKRVKRKDETENIGAVTEMKTEGKRPRGRPKLRWKDTVGRDMKAWKIREEWATDRERWKVLCKTRYTAQRDSVEDEKFLQTTTARGTKLVTLPCISCMARE